MKKIVFKKLIIKNFRNINELEIDFNEQNTEIIGENGLGKTNTLSSIMWCLFGKNIEDNKQFVISPIINGVEDNSILTSVKLILNDNYVIERSYKNRKTELKTGWVIDGIENLVAITQTNYNKELLENFVDEETFKSLSNINYIPNLHWKDLKKLIFDLIGDIKDEEVLLRDDFELIEEYVRKFGIEQTQKLLQETEKSLNEQIKVLETQYQTLLNTKEKYVVEDTKHNELVARKEEIEKEIYNLKEQESKRNLEVSNYFEKKRKIEELEYDIKRIEKEIQYDKAMIQDYENLYKQNAYDVEMLRRKDIERILRELDMHSLEKKKSENLIENYSIIVENLKNNGNKLKQKEVKVENETCSACGQKLPEDKIKETLEKLKQQQLEELQKIKEDYDRQKKELEKAQEKYDIECGFVKGLNEELEFIKNKEYQVEEETSKQKEIRVAKETKEIHLKELEQKLNDLNIVYCNKREEFDNIEEPLACEVDYSVLKQELDTINESLATTITLNKISEDIEKTLKELNDKKNNKIANKEKMQQVIKFNNIKAELLKFRTKEYFGICEFRTKETTLNGDEVECFKIVDANNIEFKEVNSAKKILMGIDLICGIQKAKNIYLPLIVDNVETVTSDIKTNTQLIVARATKGVSKLEVK